VRPDYGMGQFQQRVMKVLVKNILNIWTRKGVGSQVDLKFQKNKGRRN
jgi:hypothetical protein